MLAKLLQKENVLIAVAIVCIILYFYGKQLNQHQKTQAVVKWLPVLGGIAYGFNTLIQIAK